MSNWECNIFSSVQWYILLPSVWLLNVTCFSSAFCFLLCDCGTFSQVLWNILLPFVSVVTDIFSGSIKLFFVLFFFAACGSRVPGSGCHSIFQGCGVSRGAAALGSGFFQVFPHMYVCCLLLCFLLLWLCSKKKVVTAECQNIFCLLLLHLLWRKY